MRITVEFKKGEVIITDLPKDEHNPKTCVFDETLKGKTELTERFLEELKKRKSTEPPALLFNRLRNEYR